MRPLSVRTAVSTRCSARTENRERARKLPSNGDTPRHCDAHRAYQDEAAVIASNPSGTERDPTAGNAGAGRPFGKAGMPSPLGRAPHTQRRLASFSTYLRSHGWWMAPRVRTRSTVPRTQRVIAAASGGVSVGGRARARARARAGGRAAGGRARARRAGAGAGARAGERGSWCSAGGRRGRAGCYPIVVLHRCHSRP